MIKHSPWFKRLFNPFLRKLFNIEICSIILDDISYRDWETDRKSVV